MGCIRCIGKINLRLISGEYAKFSSSDIANIDDPTARGRSTTFRLLWNAGSPFAGDDSMPTRLGCRLGDLRLPVPRQHALHDDEEHRHHQ